MAQMSKVQYVQFYTEGSAARKLDVKAFGKQEARPRPRKQKRIKLYIDPVAIAGIAVAAVMLVLMVVGVFQLRDAQYEKTLIAQQVANLKQEHVLLQNTYTSGYDLEELAQTAQALGLVPKEQVPHITLENAPVSVEEEPDTWSRFWTFLTGLFA